MGRLAWSVGDLSSLAMCPSKQPWTRPNGKKLRPKKYLLWEVLSWALTPRLLLWLSGRPQKQCGYTSSHETGQPSYGWWCQLCTVPGVEHEDGQKCRSLEQAILVYSYWSIDCSQGRLNFEWVNGNKKLFSLSACYSIATIAASKGCFS